MTTFDFAPLFRTAIGFDRLAQLMDTVGTDNGNYPPYNIEKTGEESYRLTMAVAGFGPEDLELTVQDNTLTVTGKTANGAGTNELLYRGIAGRAFERRFVLAEHIVVEGADLQNGLLHVGLMRVIPEQLKPRHIAITKAAPVIANDEAKSAAAA